MSIFASIAIVFAVLNYAHAYRFLGRVNPATRELTWPGTGISFNFTGTKATISVDFWGSNSIELAVDNNITIIPELNGTAIATPSGLSNATHTVVLRKRSEAYYGSIYINGVSTDGTFEQDVNPTRRIEFIGDSITVGYGLDGVAPCSNSADVEDNPKTYGALAADVLGADYSMIAWSGIGVTRNYASSTPDTSPTMPVRWTHYGAQDADNSYTFPSSNTPNAVVIALGTNDFSYQGVRDPLNATFFTDSLVSFVRTIQTHYPAAEYFFVTSPMLSDSWPTSADAQKTTQAKAFQDTIAKLNTTKAHVVEWPTQGSSTGCDSHPNAATHASGAAILTKALSSVLGW